MIQETMCQLWGTQEQEVHRACKEYVLLTASRQDIKSGKFKHSYHLIFPQIHLECNSGRLKQLAQKLSKHEGLQARGKNGERLGMIDSKVYSRYQNYRLVESCKKATTWSGVEAAGVLKGSFGEENVNVGLNAFPSNASARSRSAGHGTFNAKRRKRGHVNTEEAKYAP